MGASFGAGGAQTLFGSDGSGNVLTQATALLVALFFASSFGLALLANQKSVTVDELDLALPAAVETEVPATRTPQVDVDKLVSPGRPVNTGTPRAQESSQKVWSNAGITKFYDDCKLGKYRSPEGLKRRNRIEAEIIKAASEGRITA